ncbi:MAG: CopD family protein [Thermomicrobiales bacterium]|nr:CopD family protein [Thermomicrobiales bacterium]
MRAIRIAFGGRESYSSRCEPAYEPQRRGDRRSTGAAWAALLVVLLAAAGLAAPSPAAAHAFVESSTPTANAVLPSEPSEVRLRFTEPLERSYSKAELFDQNGQALPGAVSRFTDDPNEMILSMPAGLPNGTYSVLWRTLSTADAHTAQGYIPFTIGTQKDVRPVAAPAVTAVSTGAPAWAQAASRWLALLGLAAMVAIWPVWLFVLRPSISPAWQAGPTMTRRARRFATGAIVFAMVANVIALAVQAMATLAGGGFLGSLTTTLFETRYGTLWLIRIGLALIFAAALLGVGWWWPRRRPAPVAAALLLAALLPLPFSLLAHAAAQPEGRASAIAFDYAHLLGASIWVGGVFALLAVLAPTLRDLTPAGRQVVLGRALPRFSLLALIAWGVMTLTGVYAAWLQVGNLTALTTTPYGQSLLLKLVLLVPLLALAAFNLFVVTRKIAQATDEERSTSWSGNFVTLVAAEAVLVTLVLGVVGMLIGQAPAREELALGAGRMLIHLDAAGQPGTLIITPGTVGENHYRLELGSGHEAHLRSPGGADAVLRFSLPERKTGQTEVRLAPAASGAFEGHGSELSIVGDWTIEAVVKAAGQPDWDASVTRAVGTEPPASDQPPPPPRFGPSGIAGLLLMIGGLVGVCWAAFSRQSMMRREAIGLGLAALAIGLLVLFQARSPAATSAADGSTALVERPDQALVTRGEPLFARNCASCHGAGGQGDGPAATELGAVPANLTVSHARAHGDDTLEFWVKYGIGGTKMPGFGDELSDEQIRDVVAYLRELQWTSSKAAEAPGAEACTVEPRSIVQMRDLAGAATPVAVPLGAGGAPADAAEVAEVHATVRELVACSNAGDAMRRLALYSDARIAQAYPDGPDAALERIAGTAIPVLPRERVALLDISDAWRLPDGRLRARVTLDNPQFHSHAPATPGAEQQQSESATLVFARAGDRLTIDGMQQ